MTRNEKAIYWRRHVADYRASGLSGHAYAKRVGVFVSGLSYWRKRVATSQQMRSTRVDDDAGFRSVHLGASRVAGPATLEIGLLSGLLVRLTGPVDPEWLAVVMRPLETPCS
jgi:hypothetical protein